jgi:hypothetical protein
VIEAENKCGEVIRKLQQITGLSLTNNNWWLMTDDW